MTSGNAYHITPTDGEWAVKAEGEPGVFSVHPTQAEAVAGAWELVKDRDAVEVVAHGEDGRIRSSLTIRQVEDPIDPDDIALRREAERITPGIDALLRMARKPSAVGADLEADPADLY